MLGRILRKNMFVTFLVMAVSILLTGVMSVQLFFYFSKNFEFIAEHGTDAIADGAFMQFMELSLVGLLALGFYLLFKTCENILVSWLAKN